jgi:DNA primase
VILANDADVAGHEGIRNAYQQLSAKFPHILAAKFQPGQDPASVAARDRSALQRALRDSRPAADLIIDQALTPYLAKLDNAEARVCALHAATRVIATLGPSDVSRQVARVSERLDFPTASVTHEVIDALSGVPLRPHVRGRAAYPPSTLPGSGTAPKRRSPRTSRKEYP